MSKDESTNDNWGDPRDYDERDDSHFGDGDNSPYVAVKFGNQHQSLNPEKNQTTLSPPEDGDNNGHTKGPKTRFLKRPRFLRGKKK